VWRGLALTKAMASLLYGVSAPTGDLYVDDRAADLRVFDCLLCARAPTMRVDPMVALRYE